MTSPRSRPRSGTGATSPTSAVAAKASRGVAIRHAAGSWNVLALGTIGSGNSSPASRNLWKTTSAWYISHAVSSSTDKYYWDRLLVVLYATTRGTAFSWYQSPPNPHQDLHVATPGGCTVYLG